MSNLHTPEQKRAKVKGLIETVRMLKKDFDSGALDDVRYLKHQIEVLAEIAEQADSCVDSFTP